MGIVKLSSSKRQVQFISDDGTVYVTSAAYVKQLLYGYKEHNMLLLSKYPEKASMDRFQVSPVYDPTGKGRTEIEQGSDTTGSDALSVKSRQDTKLEKVYNQDYKDF